MTAFIDRKPNTYGPTGIVRVPSSNERTHDLDSLRVLVVDNDPRTGQLLSASEQAAGYHIVEVSDGREAYRILKLDADFQVAVFNMDMPQLKGADLVRYMKTEKRLMRIPVVVVGNVLGMKTITDSFVAGAVAFLPKPLMAAQLHNTVRLAMSTNRQHRKELRPAA